MAELSISEVLQKVVTKIKTIRKEKGYSLEYMAEELKISTSAYNKIERNDTNLTLERTLQIQRILEVTITELLDLKIENIYNQHLKDNAVGHQQIQNLYQENKEVINKLISTLQDEILFLRGKTTIS